MNLISDSTTIDIVPSQPALLSSKRSHSCGEKSLLFAKKKKKMTEVTEFQMQKLGYLQNI